jgi:thimet oligopeptidase
VTTPAPLALPSADQTAAWLQERAAANLATARMIADSLRAGGAGDTAAALAAWNDLEIALGNVLSPVELLANVHPDLATRETAEAIQVEASKLVTELGQDPELYAVFAALDDTGLDAGSRRLLGKVLRDFRRSGVDRPAEVRARLREINERLTDLDLEFSRITRDDVRTVRVTPDRLGGMPADWVEAHPVDEDGLVTITTEYPDSVPVRTFAADRELRREMTHAFLDRGYPTAEPVLHELFALRHELATLVGYPDWPSYDAEVKMIGSGAAIPEFIDKIAAAATAPMEADLAVLLKRFGVDHPDATEITGVDTAYYQELVRKEQYDVDAQLVRTYFDFADVRAGLLSVTGRLFGLRWEPVEVATWHEDVASYDVHLAHPDDAVGTTESLLGRIHLDLHPRTGKYSHAAQFTLVSGVEGVQLPEGVLVCNFPRGLMEHDDVVTLFHEFGHLLHHLLAGHGHWARFSGVATEWDFVEAPSQMLEEWAWDANVLASFSRNADGEPIPAELVAKMRAAEEYGKGIQARQQMFYAAVSYWFHADLASGPDRDLTARMAELQDRYAPTRWIEGTHFFANFGHLGGYSSAYYTYMWSLVIAKDLFARFDPTDLFDQQIAGRYRDLVLARGGEQDAANLVADFLGRPFSFDAYAAWLAG